MPLLHPATHPPPSCLSETVKRQGPFVSVAPVIVEIKSRVPLQVIQSAP